MLSASLTQELTAYRANLCPARLQAVYCTRPGRQTGSVTQKDRQTERQSERKTHRMAEQTSRKTDRQRRP